MVWEYQNSHFIGSENWSGNIGSNLRRCCSWLFAGLNIEASSRKLDYNKSSSTLKRGADSIIAFLKSCWSDTFGKHN